MHDHNALRWKRWDINLEFLIPIPVLSAMSWAAFFYDFGLCITNLIAASHRLFSLAPTHIASLCPKLHLMCLSLIIFSSPHPTHPHLTHRA